jgi:hypothetical protein
MLIAIKRMKSIKFKVKTTELRALQASECCPYGNTANSVETAPVPVRPSENLEFGRE